MVETPAHKPVPDGDRAEAGPPTTRLGVVRHRLTPRLDHHHHHPRLGVARHRLTLPLHHHRVLALATALALLGLGTVAASAAPDPAPANRPVAALPDADAEDPAGLVDRDAAAERADRSYHRELALPRAAEPEVSPAPEPEPEPEPEPPPEPDPPPATAEATADWVHPMPGAAVTSCYGWRWGAMHAGVDLALPFGTPILAVGAGTVTQTGWVYGGYGISVVVDHGNGFLTHYAHAAEATVSPGQFVSPGQMIAREGSTGDSTGPHLHFEVHQGMWNPIEPTSWLRERGVEIGGC